MVVLIAMLTGISDVAALGAIFGVNAAMILFGLLQEHYEEPGGRRWMPYWFGVLTGAVPWLADRHLPVEPASERIPARLRLRDLLLAVRVLQQLRDQHGAAVPPGREVADYLYGESVYVFLSLTAKSLLAWQVFGGTLR